MRSTLTMSPLHEQVAGGERLLRGLLAAHGAEHVLVQALHAHAHAADPVPLEHRDVLGRDRLRRGLDGVHARSVRHGAREHAVSTSSSSAGGSAVGVPPPTKSWDSGVPGRIQSISLTTART